MTHDALARVPRRSEGREAALREHGLGLSRRRRDAPAFCRAWRCAPLDVRVSAKRGREKERYTEKERQKERKGETAEEREEKKREEQWMCLEG